MTFRLLGTVRARFAVLLLVAAAPLSVTGAVIAYQNARLNAERSTLAVAAARDVIDVRQQSRLVQAESLLTALGISPMPLQDSGPVCSAALARLLEIAPDRIVRIALVDSAGQVRCASATKPLAGVTAQEAALVARAGTSGKFEVGEIILSPSGPVLPVALAIPGVAGREPIATLLAVLNEKWLQASDLGPASRPNLKVWLLPATGDPVSLSGPAEQALPSEAALTRLDAAPTRLVEGAGQDGHAYIFARADLLPGTRILLAEPTQAARSAADMLFGWPIAELVAVLLAGLAAVAIGADRSIGRPLKQVSAAVARWRAGGQFQPGPMTRAPDEIVALAQSFTEATAALSVREQQLRDATAHQELLMQEIHHRVKNNLQVVASLLNLQANRIRQPEAKAEFHAARDRIRALATLHRHLYAHGELHTINMRGFLEELCEQLMHAMGESRDSGRIALTIEAPEIQISSDQAVPIALLVTEAVSNAVKYAFPGGRSGHVAVRLAVSRDAAGQEIARLSIDDDGVGIPAGRADTDAGVRDGLGLHLIRGFAGQLGSPLVVVAEHGTHYAVDIVLHRERIDPSPARAE